MSEPRTREDSMVVLNLALAIADETVRVEIESCALALDADPGGDTIYDLSQANYGPDVDPTYKVEAIRIAQRAARYIRARGASSWTWRMVQVGDNPDLVRFEEIADGN